MGESKEVAADPGMVVPLKLNCPCVKVEAEAHEQHPHMHCKCHVVKDPELPPQPDEPPANWPDVPPPPEPDSSGALPAAPAPASMLALVPLAMLFTWQWTSDRTSLGE